MMQIGEEFEYDGKRVVINSFLGRGKGGYSYLIKYGEQLAVLKKMHYEKCEVYTFAPDKLECELRDYKILQRLNIPMPRLITYNEQEQYLIKEYIDGPSLAEELALKDLPFSYFEQMYGICKVLYANHLNIDYMPQNFVVQAGKIYYVDFECNDFSPEWDFEHWGIYFWVNQEGMKKFIDTGDYKYISVGGKPVINSGMKDKATFILQKLVSDGGKRVQHD